MIFSDDQQSELKQIARDLVISRKWEALSWDDAWVGKFPDKETDDEVNKEFAVLIKKASRIMTEGLSESDYSSIKEHARTISLEFSDALKLNSQ